MNGPENFSTLCNAIVFYRTESDLQRTKGSDSLRSMRESCVESARVATLSPCARINKPSSVFAIIRMTCCLWIITQHCACEDDLPAVPEEAPPAPISLDVEHMGVFKADREIAFTNMVLVWQPDPAQSGRSAISLTSERPMPDRSRVLFGSFVAASSLERLKEESADFVGGSRLNLHGNGVFSPLAAYQPRLARLEIKRIESGNISGTIRGEFHCFRLMQPSAKPTTVEGEFEFSAKLLDRTAPAHP